MRLEDIGAILINRVMNECYIPVAPINFQRVSRTGRIWPLNQQTNPTNMLPNDETKRCHNIGQRTRVLLVPMLVVLIALINVLLVTVICRGLPMGMTSHPETEPERPDPRPSPTVKGGFLDAIEVSSEELQRLLAKYWPQSNARFIPITTNDDCYMLYSLEDFKEFVDQLDIDLSLEAENGGFNDCDDRAAIAYGREREWFISHYKTNSLCGSSFGIFRANVQTSDCETPNAKNYVMNVFVDSKKKVYGFDLATGKTYQVPNEWCNNTDVRRIFI